jgi:hypothetical protein
LLRRTSGVRPIVCRMLSKIFAMLRASRLRKMEGLPFLKRDREPSPTWKPAPTSAPQRACVAFHFKASSAP